MRKSFRLVERAAYRRGGVRIGAYGYPAADGVQVPQQLRRGVGRAPVAAAYRPGVYLEYLSCRVQPLHCGECGVSVYFAAAVIEPVPLVKLRQQVEVPDDVRLRDIGKLSTMRIVCAGRGVRTAVMLNDLPRLLNGVVDCGSCERMDGSDNIVIALEAPRRARVVFKAAVNIDQPAVLFSEPVQLRLEPRFVFLTDAPYFARYRTVRADTERSKVVWRCRFCFIMLLSSVSNDRVGEYGHNYRLRGSRCQVYKKELT